LKALYPTETERPTRRVFLAGVRLRNRPAWEFEDSMEELAQLTVALGAKVVGRGAQKLDRPCAATFLGRGKAEEFARQCCELEADTVVFDDELTPAQTRNLEEIFQRKILDRTALILDIFARRAQTKEGKLQVELARLEHLLPRLAGYWSHLSRQRGGIGVRGGEGEKQLEMDRRRVLQQIDRLKKQLEEVRRRRRVQREGRLRRQWPLASLVGYTNAGKSTLFNALTGARSAEMDQLFATLDPMTRRLRLPTNRNVLLSDTVGFIRKLPTQLVEAFKATLEEVVHADLLLHVVDATHPQAEDQIAAVESVLEEIGALEKPILLIFNKIDRLHNGERLNRRLAQYPAAVAVSAKTGEGFDALMNELSSRLRPARRLIELELPHSAGPIHARLREVGQIIEANYDGPTARLKARIPPHCRAEFAPYITADLEA